MGWGKAASVCIYMKVAEVKIDYCLPLTPLVMLELIARNVKGTKEHLETQNLNDILNYHPECVIFPINIERLFHQTGACFCFACVF